MQSVYLDSTIPSYYYETRKDHIIIARREITRKWWQTQKEKYKVHISEYVLNELRGGDYPSKQKVLKLVKDIEVLEHGSEVKGIASAYITHKLMPKDDTGDAMHLALASYHKIDYLLTWNCKHLANANKIRHIKIINGLLGLATPVICTPEQLFIEGDEIWKTMQ